MDPSADANSSRVIDVTELNALVDSENLRTMVTEVCCWKLNSKLMMLSSRLQAVEATLLALSCSII